MFTAADFPSSPVAGTRSGGIHDTLGRPLQELRLSVTDRCNFRCGYCMPKEVFGEAHAYLPRQQILSFEELTLLAQVFVRLGVRKIRVTGGEPLLRRDLPVLIRQLKAIEGLQELTLTTNGSALLALAKPLREAGLDRITVSVDALDEEKFRIMNDVDFPLHRVLRGLDAALEAGFSPIKINMVVKRGVNEDEILPMARRFRGPDFVLRFIEYMDVGTTNGWRMRDVMTAGEIQAILEKEMPLVALPARQGGEVARRFRWQDGGGEIGIVASVTQPFCRGCNRARISADGRFFPCLFAASGHDLRSLLREGNDDEALATKISDLWRKRDDRYSELRTASASASTQRLKAEMSQLGG